MWAGVSPWWVRKRCSQKLVGVLWEMLEEIGSSPCQRRCGFLLESPMEQHLTIGARRNGRWWSDGRWHLLPPIKWKWELGLHLCCVFRFQALQAGTVPYGLYSPWPGKSWSSPGYPGTSAVLMSNSRPCDVNSFRALYSNPQAHRRRRRRAGG